jgi:hypothetical protein
MDQEWLKDRISRSALQTELQEIKTRRMNEFGSKRRLVAETFDECIKEVAFAFPEGQDRIGREALRKTLITKRAERANQTALDDTAWTIASVFEECINAVESAPPTDKWIPVGEGLPEENICDDGYHEPSECVLVQTSSGQMYTSRYWSRDKKNVWTDLSYPTTEEVVAWQPLPEQYKEPEISPEIFGRGM